jgi:hypothetical protein
MKILNEKKMKTLSYKARNAQAVMKKREEQKMKMNNVSVY